MHAHLHPPSFSHTSLRLPANALHLSPPPPPRGPLWLLCLPMTHLIDLPDTTAEVLTALALVAFVNWAIRAGSELAVKSLK